MPIARGTRGGFGLPFFISPWFPASLGPCPSLDSPTTAQYYAAMRSALDSSKLQLLLRELGLRARSPGKIYLTGGASALLEGWRDSTVDVDLKLEPEPGGIFQAIAELKNRLDVNIELASPDQFLPSLADWDAHSRFVTRHGKVEFYHYDFRAQALAKLARAHERDLLDVSAMIDRQLVSAEEIKSAFEEIRPQLIRFPGLDAEVFEKRVFDFLRKQG